MFSCGASFTFFWRNVYWCALVPQNTPCPEKHYSICKTLHVKFTQCSESVSLDNWSVICIVTLGYDCIRHFWIPAYWARCLFRCMQAYSVIFSITFHIHITLLRYIQAYLGISSTLYNTGCLFKTLWNFDQAYSEPCHRAHNIRHIQKLVRCLHILAYFSKVLYLISLKGFWICLSFKKYSLICRVA